MNKLLNNKKLKLLLAFVSLMLLIDQIQDTYAKYISTADANSSLTIARWAFTVNNQDVVANNNFSNTIVPVLDANPNIKTGVIAPTSTGYFDITIDSSDVGVAFDEEITISPSNSNTVDDLIIVGYKKNGGTLTELGNTNTITTTHPLNEVTTTNTYRFYIEWIDDENETMDNSDDTDAATSGTAAIHVNLRFIQKANTTNSENNNENNGNENNENNENNNGS